MHKHLFQPRISPGRTPTLPGAAAASHFRVPLRVGHTSGSHASRKPLPIAELHSFPAGPLSRRRLVFPHRSDSACLSRIYVGPGREPSEPLSDSFPLSRRKLQVGQELPTSRTGGSRREGHGLRLANRKAARAGLPSLWPNRKEFFFSLPPGSGGTFTRAALTGVCTRLSLD